MSTSNNHRCVYLVSIKNILSLWTRHIQKPVHPTRCLPNAVRVLFPPDPPEPGTRKPRLRVEEPSQLRLFLAPSIRRKPASEKFISTFKNHPVVKVKTTADQAQKPRPAISPVLGSQCLMGIFLGHFYKLQPLSSRPCHTP